MTEEKICTPKKRLFQEETFYNEEYKISTPKKVRFTLSDVIIQDEVKDSCSLSEESSKTIQSEEYERYETELLNYYVQNYEQEIEEKKLQEKETIYEEEMEIERRKIDEYEEFYKIIATGKNLKEMEEDGYFIQYIVDFLSPEYIKAHSLPEEYRIGERKKERIGELTYNAHGVFCEKKGVEIGYVLFTGRDVSKVSCRKCKDSFTWCRHIVAILLNLISKKDFIIYSEPYPFSDKLQEKIDREISNGSFEFLNLFEKSLELYDYNQEASFKLALDLSDIILNDDISLMIKEKVRRFWEVMIEKKWNYNQKKIIKEKFQIWHENHSELYPSFVVLYDIVNSEYKNPETLLYLYHKFQMNKEEEKAKEIKERLEKIYEKKEGLDFVLKLSTKLLSK